MLVEESGEMVPKYLRFVAVPEEVKDFFRVLAAKGALVVVSICSIYYICQKSSHRFLPNFFSVIADIVLIELIK